MAKMTQEQMVEKLTRKANRPFWKKKRFIVPAAVIAVGIIASAAGGNDTPTQTSSSGATKQVSAEPTKQEASKADGNVKDVKPNITATVLGVKINIAEVKVYKDKVEVGMNYENTNSQKVSFYPNQGHAIIGSMQMDANMFLGKSTDLGGDLNSGIKQEGIIVFTPPEGKEVDVAATQNVKLDLGSVITEDLQGNKDVTIDIPIK